MTIVFILGTCEENIEKKDINVDTIQIQKYIQYGLCKESIALNDGYITIWYGKQHISLGKNNLMTNFIMELDEPILKFKNIYGPIIITFHKVTLLRSFSHEYPELLCHYIDIPFTNLNELSYSLETRTQIPTDYTEHSYDIMKNRVVWSTKENDALQNKLLQIYMYNKRCQLNGITPKKCTTLNTYLANHVLHSTLIKNPNAICPITMNLLKNEDYVYIGGCGHIVGSEGINLTMCPLCRHPSEWLRVKNSISNPFHNNILIYVAFIVIGIIICIYI